MTYEKPTMHAIGNAQALVLGTKGPIEVFDGKPPDDYQSLSAYEADE